MRRRFTPSGRWVLGTGFGALVWGINTHATLSYQLLTLAVALVGLAVLAAPSFRARFTARRHLPRYATAGAPARYTVELRSHSRRAQRGLRLMDVLCATPPPTAELQRRPAGRAEGHNWFDRRVGYPRWVQAMRHRLGGRLDPAPVPELGPQGVARVRIELLPERRGFIQFGRLRVLRSDPLGLFNAETRCGEGERLLVLPRRYPVNWRAWSGGARARLGGSSESASVGGSQEYAASREYRPGDPLRLIHWRSWARLGVPVVKEFHDECFVRHALVLDTALPGDAGSVRFEEAVSVAASFAASAPSEEGVVELLFVGADTYCVDAGPGIGSNAVMLEALACARPAAAQRFALLASTVLAHAVDLNACVLVLLAWDAPRRALVSRLRECGVESLVLVISEGNPAAESGALQGRADRVRVLRCGRVASDLEHSGLAGSGAHPAHPAADAA